MNSYQVAERFGQMSKGEVDLLKKCALQLGADPIIVNIGAGYGTSAMAILEARPDAFIFSVDIQERPEEQRHIEEAGLDSSRVLRILSPSYRAGKSWSTLLDMLFIDGSHAEDRVKGDIEVWVPKVMAGGIVLFHDYKHRNVPWITNIVREWAESSRAIMIGEDRYLAAFRLPE